MTMAPPPCPDRLGPAPRRLDHRGRLRQRIPLCRTAAHRAAGHGWRQPRRLCRHLFQGPVSGTSRRLSGGARAVARGGDGGAGALRSLSAHPDRSAAGRASRPRSFRGASAPGAPPGPGRARYAGRNLARPWRRTARHRHTPAGPSSGGKASLRQGRIPRSPRRRKRRAPVRAPSRPCSSRRRAPKDWCWDFPASPARRCATRRSGFARFLRPDHPRRNIARPCAFYRTASTILSARRWMICETFFSA